jgi:hypothetical protein
MAQTERQEYRAKVMEIGGMLRGWIPSRIVAGLKARNGDYIVFRKSNTGQVEVSARRQTPSEKRRSVAKAKAGSTK